MLPKSDTQASTMRELARLEKRMEKRWYNLAMAEQRGQPVQVLKRMYDAYLSALDDYIAYQRHMNGKNASSRLAS